MHTQDAYLVRPSLKIARALLRHAHPSAQVKAAAAHARRLKRNQRKKKLVLSLWEFSYREPEDLVGSC
jgi:hypothetical protein